MTPGQLETLQQMLKDAERMGLEQEACLEFVKNLVAGFDIDAAIEDVYDEWLDGK